MKDNLKAMNIKPPNQTTNTQRKPRTPKKITPTYLHNSGLYYLQRFSASTGRFREIMLRKVKKSCMVHEEQDYDTCASLVEDTIKTFTKAGLLNDEIYAEGRIISMRRAGKSTRFIQSSLRAKYIAPHITIKLLKKHEERSGYHHKDAEQEAAKQTAQKKKLGPYRTKEISEEEKADFMKKDLGKLARAGFSYEIAKRALQSPDE